MVPTFKITYWISHFQKYCTRDIIQAIYDPKLEQLRVLGSIKLSPPHSYFILTNIHFH